MEARTLGSGASPMLTLQYSVAKRLVFDKLRKVLGLDNVKYLTSGSAKLHTDVAMTFLAMGVATDFAKLKGMGKLALLYALALVVVIAPIAYGVAYLFHRGLMPPLAQ